MLYGKSEQKQYSGKNLFTFSNGSRDINGVIFEAKDGIITAKGTSTKEFTSTYFQFNYPKDIFTIGETYTFSLNSNDANLYLYALYKKNDMTDYKQLFGMTTKCATVKIPDNVDLIIRCVVRINTTVNATATIQIEKGSTATSYEPYVGGQPSPSPDYPQEIKSVVNPKVVVYGKNIAKKVTVFDISQQYEIPLYIVADLRPSTTYVLSFECASGYSGYINETLFEQITFAGTGNRQSVVCKTKSVLQSSDTITPKFTNVMLEWISASIAYEPYHEQTVTLPYTLNAIPVSSGGNVTIDGQQYIADYVDVERGKLVRMVDSSKLDNTQSIVNKTEWLLAESQEIDLTTEEITAFKALTTYYPTTNISVNSEQLDGYTAFNYPISMANGWNYVKKQLNDNRDYIYDMDIQSAEAYVNSEYAVALTELEV